MKTLRQRLFNNAASVVLFLLGAASARADGPWQVAINPGNGGRVYWGATSQEAFNHAHVLEESGPAQSSPGIWFLVEADPGFFIQRAILTQAGHPGFDETQNARQAKAFGFNSVGAGSLSVKFGANTPTGSFGFSFPQNLSAQLIPIFDVTGHFEGLSPTRIRRAYSIDIAVDPEGKIDASGTVEGYAPGSSLRTGRTPRATGPLSLLDVGQLSTVSGAPQGNFNGRFVGTRDDKQVNATGAIKLPLVIEDLGSAGPGLEGAVTYHAKVEDLGVVQDRNVPIQLPLSSEDRQKAKFNWKFQLTVAQRTDSNNKTFYAGSGQLTLQNGSIVTFAERPVKYSARRGFNIAFRGGTLGGEVQKKISITLRQLTLELQGGAYTPTGGTMKYKFLGQKGSGDLLSFGP